MRSQIRRREFIILLSGAAAAWPIAARAQQPAMPLIGYLHLGRPVSPQLIRSFHQGLSETGYVEGRNVAIEYRWAENQYDRLPALVADLVRRQVSVIAVSGGVAVARAAQPASATIPLVFQGAGDPVARGVVASLNRPGGNITGVISLNIELGPKQLEVLHELVPTATMIALLVNPTVPTISLESIIRGMQDMELEPADAGRGLLASYYGLYSGNGRIHEQRNHGCRGDKLMQHLQLLRP